MWAMHSSSHKAAINAASLLTLHNIYNILRNAAQPQCGGTAYSHCLSCNLAQLQFSSGRNLGGAASYTLILGCGLKWR